MTVDLSLDVEFFRRTIPVALPALDFMLKSLMMAKRRNLFSSWIGCYRIDVMTFFVITSIFALVTFFTYDRVILAAYCMWLRLRLVRKAVVYDVTSCVCISVDVNANFRVVPVLELLDLRTLSLDARWTEVRLLCNATRMYTVVVSVCWLAYSCTFVCVWVCGVWLCQCVCVELERSFCSKL